jgi:cytochrome c oxidase subunit 3
LVLNIGYSYKQRYGISFFTVAKAARNESIPKMLVVTAIFGVLFLALQIAGFKEFGERDIRIVGAGSNASYSFLLAISGLHGLHVLGGVVALVVMAIMAVRSSTRNYNTVPLEVVATYWHFVDLLWIYLFIFFNWMK